MRACHSRARRGPNPRLMRTVRPPNTAQVTTATTNHPKNSSSDIVSRTALIVGAGIGGLSAGLALRQAGWNIRIFERASSPRELGFGVGLAPTAIAALRELGVADVVLAGSFEPRRGELRRLDGTVLKRAELPPGALGGPMILALRPALHGALLEAVGLAAIALQSSATGFTVIDDHVTLQMANGVIVSGDLLVGADGVGSVIRRTIHPGEPPPRSSRIVAVRGAVHGALQHLGDCDGVYYLGRGVESMLVRASDTGARSDSIRSAESGGDPGTDVAPI